MRTMNLIGRGLVLALAGAVCGGVLAQDLPPQEPILRIEAGMHVGSVRGIDINASCTKMVTASDDKTARLWDISDHNQRKPVLRQIYRPPINNGNRGQIYSVALSPDERWLAAGGWGLENAKTPGQSIYIFATSTGRLLRRLGPVDSFIVKVAISPDGKYIAAHDGSLYVWRTSNWALVTHETYPKGGSLSHIAFDNRGRLWSAAKNGQVRRYAADFSRADRSGSAFRQDIVAIAPHPSATKIALSFIGQADVELLDARTLKQIHVARNERNSKAPFYTVAWSLDGERLFAGGRYGPIGKLNVRIWDKQGHGIGRNITGPKNSVFQLLPCGNAIAIGAADPAIGILEFDGRRRLWSGSVQPDARKSRLKFATSEDGMRVKFWLDYKNTQSVVFDVNAGRLDVKEAAGEKLFPPNFSAVPQSDWVNSQSPAILGRRYRLMTGGNARSLAFTREGNRFALGTDYLLHFFRKDGSRIWWRRIRSGAWAVNIPWSGKHLVAAYGDGTIRWHRLSDGKEMLALFVHAKDKRWVLWTPKGYYMASPGGESLIGWHVNQSWNKEAAFFPANLFRGQYYRPDIVRLMLTMLDEDEAIRLANARAGLPQADEKIRKILPPIVKIREPRTGSTFDKRTIRLSYTVTSANGDKPRDVEIRVDARPVPGIRGAIPLNSVDDDNVITVDVPVPARDVTVSLIAWAGDGAVKRASEAKTIKLKWAGKAPDQSKLPRMLGLFVGISDYKDNRLDLQFADDDARALEAAFKLQKGITYSSVETRLLTDAKATRREILKSLKWLREKATSDDVVVLHFAGHGVTDKSQLFHFLPHEANPDEPSLYSISKGRLREMIIRTAGKVIVFMDACHAGDGLLTPGAGLGPADMTGLVNELGSAQVGAVMYAASTGRQVSHEGLRFGGHGAFTKAILEGLAGGANLSNRPPPGIHTGEMDVWLTGRVAELTGNAQTPTMVKSTIPHFTIATVR
jgi:WD40 repeat protein